MTKKETRKFYHEKRMALSAGLVQDLQQRIFHQFISVKLPPCSKILSYSALLNRNEFDIGLINSYVHSMNASAAFYLPRLRNEYMMDAVRFDISPESIPVMTMTNQYGIPEPLGDDIIEPAQLDLVFVPLLAFDEMGYRVGYGKGYYDRYLSRCKKDIIKIGFSFFEPLPVIEDIDNYDVPLDLCITPLNVYEF